MQLSASFSVRIHAQLITFIFAFPAHFAEEIMSSVPKYKEEIMFTQQLQRIAWNDLLVALLQQGCCLSLKATRKECCWQKKSRTINIHKMLALLYTKRLHGLSDRGMLGTGHIFQIGYSKIFDLVAYVRLHL